MDWNYNMDECPLNTKVFLLSADNCPLLPQQIFIGTITDNGRVKTSGECYEGDPDYFNRSEIIAWKPYGKKYSKVVSDKEKIQYILDNGKCNTIESLLFAYIDRYPKEFSSIRIMDLINNLMSNYLNSLISQSYVANKVAEERANYLKSYLSGDMYATREAAEQAVNVQIKNAQAIIDACGGKLDYESM